MSINFNPMWSHRSSLEGPHVMSHIAQSRVKIKRKRRGGWVKFYYEELDDPAIQFLPERLRLLYDDLRRYTGECGGYLPSIPEIAFRLRGKQNEIEDGIAALLTQGLLSYVEVDGEKLLQPTGWWEQQSRPDKSTERVRRFRKRAKQATGTKRNDNETRFETDLKRSETLSSSTSSSTSTVFSVDTVEGLPEGSKGTYPRNAYARARDGGEL